MKPAMFSEDRQINHSHRPPLVGQARTSADVQDHKESEGCHYYVFFLEHRCHEYVRPTRCVSKRLCACGRRGIVQYLDRLTLVTGAMPCQVRDCLGLHGCAHEFLFSLWGVGGGGRGGQSIRGCGSKRCHGAPRQGLLPDCRVIKRRDGAPNLPLSTRSPPRGLIGGHVTLPQHHVSRGHRVTHTVRTSGSHVVVWVLLGSCVV